MPYISMNLSAKLTDEQKSTLASAVAQAVTVFSGKPRPEFSMVDIEDGKSLFFCGEPLENGAYVSVGLHGQFNLSERDAYTATVTEVLHEQLEIPANAVYLTISEFPTWGVMGKQQTGSE